MRVSKREFLMPSTWKHSWTIVATCLFGFVVFSPETFVKLPWLVSLSKFALAGGLATLGIAAHNQAVANTQAIKLVDDKVVETHTAINGRMDQLLDATNAQGRQDERDDQRHEAQRIKCPLGRQCPIEDDESSPGPVEIRHAAEQEDQHKHEK